MNAFKDFLDKKIAEEQPIDKVPQNTETPKEQTGEDQPITFTNWLAKKQAPIEN
jgi:hypothetical protein